MSLIECIFEIFRFLQTELLTHELFCRDAFLKFTKKH